MLLLRLPRCSHKEGVLRHGCCCFYETNKEGERPSGKKNRNQRPPPARGVASTESADMPPVDVGVAPPLLPPLPPPPLLPRLPPPPPPRLPPPPPTDIAIASLGSPPPLEGELVRGMYSSVCMCVGVRGVVFVCEVR